MPLFPSNELKTHNNPFEIELNSDSKSESGSFKNKISGNSSKGGTFDDFVENTFSKRESGESISGVVLMNSNTPSKNGDAAMGRNSSLKLISDGEDLEKAVNISEVGFSLEHSKTD